MSKATICDKCGKTFGYDAHCTIEVDDQGYPFQLDLCNTCTDELMKWIKNKECNKTKEG